MKTRVKRGFRENEKVYFGPKSDGIFVYEFGLEDEESEKSQDRVFD